MTDASYSGNSELLRLAAEGDEDAVAELISVNMGLVKSIAVRFRDRGADYEDLLQIGIIGMLKAVRSFDFSYNTAFSTYAVPLIIGEIRRFLRDDGIVKVSRGVKKQGIDIMRRREEFIRRNGREPRTSELAEVCGMEQSELVYALDAVSPVGSLNENLTGDEDGMTLESVIADKNNELDGLTDRIALAEAVKTLPPLQRKILALRFVRELSQQQTGAILGLTQVKISREEKKILAHLREELGNGGTRLS